MAVVSVTFDGTRVIDAESVTNWTAATATPTLEPDFRYQSSNCVSAQVKTTETGFYYRQAGVTHNFSSIPKVWIAKAIITNKDALDGNGLILEIGTGTRTAYHQYYVWSATSYPILGGWTIVPIDPNISAYRSASTGTPDLAVVDFFGIRGDCSATSKAPNLGMDAIDYITSGTGLTLVGGDGGDTDGTFLDFVSFDETTTANRYGIVATRDGILYITGVLTIGTATATGFTDSNRVLVFPSGRFDTGFCGIDFGIANASTSISINNCVFNGRGAKGTNDTRPDYSVEGNSGTLSISGTTFNVFNVMDLKSNVTMNNCNFLNGEKILQNGALLNGCAISGATTVDGYAFIFSDNPANIQSCNFTFSDGYGIEFSVAGTYSFSANSFTGYGVDGSGDAAVYNNSGGLITLNITNGGDTPTVSNGTGASTVINNAVVLTITCKNEAGLATQGIRVRIERNSDGLLIAEGTTNASGVFTTSYNYTIDTESKIVARLKGYKNNVAISTITTSGLSVPFTMLKDSAVDLP